MHMLLKQERENMMPDLSNGTAKPITKITEDRIEITHHPPRFVSIYVDPRQDAESMEKEAEWIKNKILDDKEKVKLLEEYLKCVGCTPDYLLNRFKQDIQENKRLKEDIEDLKLNYTELEIVLTDKEQKLEKIDKIVEGCIEEDGFRYEPELAMIEIQKALKEILDGDKS